MRKCLIAVLVLACAGSCQGTLAHQPAADLLGMDDFLYLGAFRLPEGEERPLTFSYGGEAMTWIPDADSPGTPDRLPGLLLIMGHNRMPYGELPDGNQVALVTIPAPVNSRDVEDLSRASFIGEFHSVASGYFTEYVEIPRVGMQYLDAAGGQRIHLCWGQHFHFEDTSTATHAWFGLDLSDPGMQGPWFIGNQSLYSTNNYLFDIPVQWTQDNTGGKLLATGRFRDGGWSGMGPALFAYSPWPDASGTPAAPQTRLQETVLLLYQSSETTEDIERAMDGYQHGDEWEGGAWITTSSGKHGVLFAGTKSTGDRYWYGFINPAGSAYPCLEEEFIGEFILCRDADGTPCGNEASWVCTEPASGRGWWSTSFSAWFILYDPDDLASVARRDLQPWEPQPYAHLVIDDYLFFNPSAVDTNILGTGTQRRYRIGDIAFDREHGYLYVLELFADEAQPVVHVWEIR